MKDTYDPSKGCSPCPFCGRPGEVYRNGGSDASGLAWSIAHNAEGCPISVFGFYDGGYPTREAAVAAWNTRKTVTIPSCVLPHLEGEAHGD